jgi:hypothetical protein
VYWYPSCDAIVFINRQLCNFKKVDVTYIATLTEYSTVQESRGFAILQMVVGLLRPLKEGTVIDKSNDANPNVSPNTEINKYLVEALRQ